MTDGTKVVVMKGLGEVVFTGVPASKLTTCKVHSSEGEFLFTPLFLLTPQS